MRAICLAAVATLTVPFGATAFAADPPCSGPTQGVGREVVRTVEQPLPSWLNAQDAVGRTAAMCRYNHSAAYLLEQEVGTRPTPLARFNLASVYARQGRLAEARTLYRSAVADGQFQWAFTDPVAGVRSRSIRFNVSDEAERRLARIGMFATPSNPTTAALAAGDVAVDVSAAVASPSTTDVLPPSPGEPSSDAASAGQVALALDGLK